MDADASGSSPSILLEIQNGVAKIVLNRPDKLNSFTASMLSDFGVALKAVSKDQSVRVLVITGAGRGFCAGQDLNARRRDDGAPDIDLGKTLDTLYHPVLHNIRSLEMPVIAAVNGVAAGAGCNIALACDLVLASKSASFIQAFCKIGLIPDCGGTWSLQRLVGRQRALGMALLGDKISAEQAESWGLIWKCIEDEAFPTEIEQLVRHLASQPTYGLSLIKRAINEGATNSFKEQLDLERDFQKLAGQSQDYKEGVLAFLEKRAPNFIGS